MKIAIITGGETAEREVSIKSAVNVAKLLDFTEIETFTFPEDLNNFINSSKNFNVAIPIIHGIGGEDGSVQGLFKNLGIPFLFSDIKTHSVAIDKKFTKEIAYSIGINAPKNISDFPLFAKPRYGGSSVASKYCNSEDEFNSLVKENPETEFLKEEPIVGREFTVGVIEKDNKTITLPVVEIVPKTAFFDFESKYNPEKLADEICPAQIDKTLEDELKRQAKLIHTHLGAKHISRSDFIVTPDNKIFFLEINTIPGMTDNSLIPKMISTSNLDFKEIFKKWIESVI